MYFYQDSCNKGINLQKYAIFGLFTKVQYQGKVRTFVALSYCTIIYVQFQRYITGNEIQYTRDHECVQQLATQIQRMRQ